MANKTKKLRLLAAALILTLSVMLFVFHVVSYTTTDCGYTHHITFEEPIDKGEAIMYATTTPTYYNFPNKICFDDNCYSKSNLQINTITSYNHHECP